MKLIKRLIILTLFSFTCFIGIKNVFANNTTEDYSTKRIVVNNKSNYYVTYNNNYIIENVYWTDGFIINLKESLRDDLISATWDFIDHNNNRKLLSGNGVIIESPHATISGKYNGIPFDLKVKIYNIKLEDGSIIDPLDITNDGNVSLVSNKAFVTSSILFKDYSLLWNGEDYEDGNPFDLKRETNPDGWIKFQKYDLVANENLQINKQGFKYDWINNPDPLLYRRFNVEIRVNGSIYPLIRNERNIERAGYFFLGITNVNGRKEIDISLIALGEKNIQISKEHFNEILDWDNFDGELEIRAYWERFKVAEDIEINEYISISSIDELPYTDGRLDDSRVFPEKVGWVTFDKNSTNLNEVLIYYNDIVYKLALSKLAGTDELGQRPLNYGVYYSDDNGKKYIYYEFKEHNNEEQKLIFIDDVNLINGFRPYAELNLSDNESNFVNKLNLYANKYDGGKGKAFVDVVFPMEIDDLLAIEIHYEMRWQILWGMNTAWEQKTITRYKNESVNMRSTWQRLSSWLFMGNLWKRYNEDYIWNEIASWSDEKYGIEAIENIDYVYKEKYLKNINRAQYKRGEPYLSIDDIFTDYNSVYRIFLNTYFDGRYTGWEIKDDISVISVIYEYKDTIYSVPYSDIIITSAGGKNDNFFDVNQFSGMINFWNGFTNFLSKSWKWIVGFIGVLIGLLFITFILNVFGAFGQSVNKVRRVSRRRRRRRY